MVYISEHVQADQLLHVIEIITDRFEMSPSPECQCQKIVTGTPIASIAMGRG